MKNFKQLDFINVKSLLITILMLGISASINAQIFVVEYMKVKDDKFNEYLEIEKSWLEIHQKMVDEGNKNGWTLYSKMFGGTNDEYDYITVNVYPDWATYEKPVSDNIMNYVNESLQYVMDKTAEVRDLVRTEVYSASVLAENAKPTDIISLAYMKVAQTDYQKYVDLEKKYFKPYFEGLIEAGARNGWGIYQKLTPMAGDFDFVAVNGFEKLSQPDSVSSEAIDEAWEKAADGIPDDQIMEEIFGARETVHSEYWRRVMGVQAEQ